jgi:Mg2+-importing ATPase
VIAVGILVPFSPIGRSVGLQALPSGFFPLLALILVGYGLSTELAKRVYIRRYGAWL